VPPAYAARQVRWLEFVRRERAQWGARIPTTSPTIGVVGILNRSTANAMQRAKVTLMMFSKVNWKYHEPLRVVFPRGVGPTPRDGGSRCREIRKGRGSNTARKNDCDAVVACIAVPRSTPMMRSGQPALRDPGEEWPAAGEGANALGAFLLPPRGGPCGEHGPYTALDVARRLTFHLGEETETEGHPGLALTRVQ